MSQSEYHNRIKKVQKNLKEGEVLFVFAATHSIRNRDVEYKFRQDSDFYYLTGITESDSILVIKHKSSHMFCLPKDKSVEIWTGIRLGKNEIKKQLNLTETFDLSEWKKELPEILTNVHTIYYFFGINPDRDREILSASKEVNSKSREGKFGPEKIVQPSFLHEMRLIKSKEEIRLLQESARITGIAHNQLLKDARPGMKEYELESILEGIYLKHGAWGGGYEHIVATGKNSCILHYVDKQSILETGDLVLVDSGAEKNYYTADVTRTFPVDKKFTPAQSHIYQLVLAAQKNAIKMAVANQPFMDIQEATIRFFSEALLDLGICEGSLDEVLESGEYKKYYMHKIGHYLGMDVHDVGTYYLDGKKRKLEDGMVITIEPGLYFDPTDKSIPKEFRGIGIRIEDDILISGKKPINLTIEIPKEIEEIEDLRSYA
jgi:Xaa-Pro aminopeptidase